MLSLLQAIILLARGVMRQSIQGLAAPDENITYPKASTELCWGRGRCWGSNSQLPELFQTDAPVTFDIPYRSFLAKKNPKAVLSKKSEALFSAKAHFLIFFKGTEYNYLVTSAGLDTEMKTWLFLSRWSLLCKLLREIYELYWVVDSQRSGRSCQSDVERYLGELENPALFPSESG
ncbi:hypothetical protein Q9966_007857 [Columba livia]|nr:hypothetical protein Q9966_007857 [Columba livia]